MKTCDILIASLFVFGVLASVANSQQNGGDSCTTNLQLLNVQLPFNATSFSCNTVWSSYDYILRYMQTGPGEWSFVLSAPKQNAYIGMGFSPDGKMVGSSAIVGWVGSDGTAVMKKYYLGGKSPGAVVPEQGNLQLGNAFKIVTTTSRTYMAFQLVNTAAPSNNLIYSIGIPNAIPQPSSYRLTQHQDYSSTRLNYATGQTQTSTANTDSLKRSHGILVIIGWGILMAIGAMVARYMKEFDPIWFYSHAAIQSLGYILGLAGIICGLVLNNRLDVDVSKHKAIGITVLVLASLQVLAFLARPGKESKVRKYWNWYHHSLGRALILLAAVNVFYGIHLGNAGDTWNAGYAVALVILVIFAVILESRMRMRKS